MPTPAAEGDDEVRRLRAELAWAMDRAQSAENQASMLQADLAEARTGSTDDAVGGESGAAAGGQVDKTLRFRLARSAARKKGIEEDDSNDNDDNMWS